MLFVDFSNSSTSDPLSILRSLLSRVLFALLSFQGTPTQVSFHALGSNYHNGVDNSRNSILSRCQFPALGISQSEGVHPFPPSRSSLAQFHHTPIKSTTFIRLLAGLEFYTGRGKITHFVIVQNCFTSLSCCKNSAQCRKKEFPETEAGAEALKDGWNFRYQISDLHTQQLLSPRE